MGTKKEQRENKIKRFIKKVLELQKKHDETKSLLVFDEDLKDLYRFYGKSKRAFFHAAIMTMHYVGKKQDGWFYDRINALQKES